MDINYGLIVVNKNEDERYNGDNLILYHFCGYKEKPTQKDIDILREELKVDGEMKIDNIHELSIINAPEYVINHFKSDYLKNNN